MSTSNSYIAELEQAIHSLGIDLYTTSTTARRVFAKLEDKADVAIPYVDMIENVEAVVMEAVSNNRLEPNEAAFTLDAFVEGLSAEIRRLACALEATSELVTEFTRQLLENMESAEEDNND